MRDAVALQVLDQRGLHVGIVVPVVERPRAGEEVDVLAAVDVVEHAADGRSKTAPMFRQ